MAEDAADEIRVVLEAYVNAVRSKDIEAFADLVAHDDDMVWYGTDAWEKWVGWKAVVDTHESQMGAFSVLQASYENLVIHTRGEIAWVAADMHFDVRQADNRQVSLNTRMTAVLEKRQGKWVIVQRHTSLGAKEAVAKY